MAGNTSYPDSVWEAKMLKHYHYYFFHLLISVAYLRGGGTSWNVLLNRRRPDPLNALSVQNGVTFLAEFVLIHEIGAILPHNRPTVNNWASPAKNVVIYLRCFNVWGRPRVGKGGLLRIVLPLGGFLNTPLSDMKMIVHCPTNNVSLRQISHLSRSS